MSDAGRSTKTVFHILLTWNDQKEERWLGEQERAGWRVAKVHPWGYTFEKVEPREAAYRLDYAPAARGDHQEYLALFRDAGWDLLGRRGLWFIFRKPVADGVVPEIHTDPQSRIAMYQRLVGFLALMTMATTTPVIPTLLGAPSTALAARYPSILVIQLVLAALFAYGLVRTVLTINRLKKEQRRRA